MHKFDELWLAFAGLKSEYAAFERGNKSAGTRARACAQNIRRIAQEMRQHITEVKRG